MPSRATSINTLVAIKPKRRRPAAKKRPHLHQQEILTATPPNVCVIDTLGDELAGILSRVYDELFARGYLSAYEMPPTLSDFETSSVWKMVSDDTEARHPTEGIEDLRGRILTYNRLCPIMLDTMNSVVLGRGVGQELNRALAPHLDLIREFEYNALNGDINHLDPVRTGHMDAPPPGQDPDALSDKRLEVMTTRAMAYEPRARGRCRNFLLACLKILGWGGAKSSCLILELQRVPIEDLGGPCPPRVNCRRGRAYMRLTGSSSATPEIGNVLQSLMGRIIAAHAPMCEAASPGAIGFPVDPRLQKAFLPGSQW